LIVLDKLEPFYAEEIKRHTLDVHREVTGDGDVEYRFREGDVRDSETVWEVVADVDVVVHRAAQFGIRTSVAESWKVTDINVAETVTLFATAKERRRARTCHRRERACKLIGYEPSHMITEGVCEFIEWYGVLC